MREYSPDFFSGVLKSLIPPLPPLQINLAKKSGGVDGETLIQPLQVFASLPTIGCTPLLHFNTFFLSEFPETEKRTVI